MCKEVKAMSFLVKAILTAFVCCSFTGLLIPTSYEAKIPNDMVGPTKKPTVTIILQRTYLDGEVSEEMFRVDTVSLEDSLRRYKNWQLVDRDDVQIVLQKRVNDISPLLKTSGYFGVSKEGILQIFKGIPDEKNAIHSFFQIDMEKLKSYQREKLERGIRVKSKKQYEEVIKTMKPYSMKKD
jgi:forespore regulator of the sigma-K checkpoint